MIKKISGSGELRGKINEIIDHIQEKQEGQKTSLTMAESERYRLGKSIKKNPPTDVGDAPKCCGHVMVLNWSCVCDTKHWKAAKDQDK